MFKLKEIGLIFLAIAFVISSCNKSGASDKIKLELKLDKGKSIEQLMTNKQIITTEVQGREQKIQQTMQFGFKYTVDSISPDNAIDLTCTYSSVRFDMEMGTMKVTFDSQNPTDTENPMGKILQYLVDKSFKLKLTPRLQVLDIKGVNDILESFFSTNLMPEDESKPLKDQFSRQFSDEVLKETFQSSFNIYPNNPVGVGDTWTDTLKFSKIMPMTIISTYKVKDRKDGKMTIEFTSKIETNQEAPKLDFGMGPIEYKMNGTMEGTNIIDETTGWLFSSQINQKLNGTMVLSIDARTMEVPMNTESTITIETKK